MTLERINPGELARPSGFSHAVRATGTVTVHLAGQTALDAEGRIVGGGVVGQFEQALTNLLAALRAAGGGPEHLAALTIYIVDVPDYRDHARDIGQVWRRLGGPPPPAPGGNRGAPAWGGGAPPGVEGAPREPPRGDPGAPPGARRDPRRVNPVGAHGAVLRSRWAPRRARRRRARGRGPPRRNPPARGPRPRTRRPRH